MKKSIVMKHLGAGLRTVEHALMDEHKIVQTLDTKQQKAGSKSLKGAQLPEMRSVPNIRRDCKAQTTTSVFAVIAASIYDRMEAGLVTVTFTFQSRTDSQM